MDRDQARTDYRRILAGVVRHHQALDRHVTGAAMARVAKRLGLRVKVGVIEAGDDEMALVSGLAVYGRVAGSTRAIDRYVRAASGSLDAFDQELVGALSRSWFSILRLTARHPVAGWYVDDLLLDRALADQRGAGAVGTRGHEPRHPAVRVRRLRSLDRRRGTAHGGLDGSSA
jgi:hypothetical protein